MLTAENLVIQRDKFSSLRRKGMSIIIDRQPLGIKIKFLVQLIIMNELPVIGCPRLRKKTLGSSGGEYNDRSQ